ncbi:MAG: YihY/virulence factor BrkB family protein [Myxococcales bacterium]|nr:YihY/virulence factor BrkB family protein [Myxococcales bacterium]
MSTTPVTPAQPAAPVTASSNSLTMKGLLRLFVAVVIGYRGEKLALRAGNLTFITLTSLVPLAAVMLALVHVFGSTQVEAVVLKFFEDLLNPGGRTQAERALREFKAAANSPTGSSLSFLVLLVSSGVMLRHLDASLNDVWAVRRSRPILGTLGLYVGVLVVGPLAMAVSLLGSDGIKRLLLLANFPLSGVAFTLGAVFSALVVFTLLYKVAPHAHVPWRSALIGGAAAGIAWEIARRLYGTIASLFFSANAVYGSLGIAPLFLTWVYVSWYVVLSGARLAYAVEHADFHDEFRDLLSHPRSEELIATRIAQLIARARVAQVPGPSSLGLAAQLRLPTQRIEEAVARLTNAGLIRLEAGSLIPAKDLVDLTVADISMAMGGAARTLTRERLSRTGQFDSAARLYADADEASVEKLKRITWADLALLVEVEPKT